MSNACPGFLDDAGVWNNGFNCPSIDNRSRICCGPENRRECCFADQFHHSTDPIGDTEFSLPSLLSNKNEPSSGITQASYTFIFIAIGLTMLLLIILLITFIYIVRRKLNESSSSSSCSSDTSSLNKHCRRLSVTVASSSKSSASSPVPSTYVDYWSRTIVSPSDWALTKPYSSFIGVHPNNNYNYYIDQ